MNVPGGPGNVRGLPDIIRGRNIVCYLIDGILAAWEMWGYEKPSDGVLLVLEDCGVGEEAFESKPDPVEIRFNHHASSAKHRILENKCTLAHSLTDSSWTV